MSISEISPIGLPESLKYSSLPSISDDVTCYQVNVAPSGLTSVQGATVDSTPFIATGAGGFRTNPSTPRI